MGCSRKDRGVRTIERNGKAGTKQDIGRVERGRLDEHATFRGAPRTNGLTPGGMLTTTSRCQVGQMLRSATERHAALTDL